LALVASHTYRANHRSAVTSTSRRLRRVGN
jgi:hypothetical protein